METTITKPQKKKKMKPRWKSTKRMSKKWIKPVFTDDANVVPKNFDPSPSFTYEVNLGRFKLGSIQVCKTKNESQRGTGGVTSIPPSMPKQPLLWWYSYISPLYRLNNKKKWWNIVSVWWRRKLNHKEGFPSMERMSQENH